MRWPLSRAFVKKLMLLAGGLVAGLVFAEIALRVAGISYPQPYIPDPYCGTRLQPGFEAWFTKEGRAYVQINRAGFRDREHAPEKPPGTYRIAVLGDSYAEATQVPLQATFWSVMGKRLEQCAWLQGKKVEVLNFGVSGFGTAQELQVLRHYVWPYQPDLVLLAFLTGNDVSDNSPALSGGVRPYFRLDGDRLVLDDSFRRHPDYLKALSRWTQCKVALINRSRLLQVAAEAKNRWHERAAAGQPGGGGLDVAIYGPPSSAAWKEAWTVTERLIVQMASEVRQHGAAFCLVTLSNDIQVHPDPEVRRAFAARLGVDDLFYPDQRIARLGRRGQFPVIVLAPRMQAYAQQHQVYLHGFANTQPGAGHWNTEGHRLAGTLIAEDLCSAGPW